MKVNGYEFKNEEELHELLEADVITYEEYEDILEKFRANQPIKKERTNWKEKYFKEKEMSNYWWNKYHKLENMVLNGKTKIKCDRCGAEIEGDCCRYGDLIYCDLCYEDMCGREEDA